MVRFEDLKPHPKNPRKGDTSAIGALIMENGFFGAVVAQRSTGHILVGNHRYLAFKEQGAEVIPTIWVDVDDERALKILLSDNRASDLGGYDDAALAELLQSLNGGLVATGYDQSALDSLLADIAKHNPEKDAAPKIDQAAELRATWGTEPGQLWEIGKHRLLVGDATCEADVARLLGGEKPNLMVTDPPYGVEYDPNWRNEAAEKGQLAYADRRIGNVPNDGRADWREAWALSPSDVAYTWSPAGSTFNSHCAALNGAGFEQRITIIWAKPHFPISRGHYTVRHEPCIYAVRKGATALWIGDSKQSTLWDIALDKNVAGGHSTQKPLECMARPIRNHSGDVYDPFGGSGTTMVAAENLGRRCWMMEIDPGYCAVILERMKDIGLEGVLRNYAERV